MGRAGQPLLYLLAFWLAVALVSLGASRRWVFAATALGLALVAALTLLSQRGCVRTLGLHHFLCFARDHLLYRLRCVFQTASTYLEVSNGQ